MKGVGYKKLMHPSVGQENEDRVCTDVRVEWTIGEGMDEVGGDNPRQKMKQRVRVDVCSERNGKTVSK